jgi:hypothetical protein
VGEIFHSLGEVNREGFMTLFQRVEIGGADKFIPFEQRILVLRESESTLIWMHDEFLLREGPTSNDWYGYLSSAKYAAEDAIEMAKKLRVGVGDRLAFEVKVTVSERPCLVDDSREAQETARKYAGKAYRKTYRSIPTYSSRSGYWFVSDTPDAQGNLQTLRSRVILEWPAIFSSRRDPLEVPVDLESRIRERLAAEGSHG